MRSAILLLALLCVGVNAVNHRPSIAWPAGAVGSWSTIPKATLVLQEDSKPRCRNPTTSDSDFERKARMGSFYSWLQKDVCETETTTTDSGSEDPIMQRHNLTTHSGRAGFRALTNVTSETLKLIASFRAGQFQHDTANHLTFNGQRVDRQTMNAWDSSKQQEDELPTHGRESAAASKRIKISYLLFGHGLTPPVSSPYVGPFKVMDHPMKNKRWLNATGVKNYFGKAINITSNSTFRRKMRPENTVQECLWVGFVELELGEQDTYHYRALMSGAASDDPKTPATGPVFQASFARGEFVSTCNLSFSFNASHHGYVEVSESGVTFALWMIAAVPLAYMGLIRQYAFIKDSRSRALRYSLLSCMWQLCLDFLIWMYLMINAWSYPFASKALGAATVMWFVQFTVCGCRFYNQLVAAYKVDQTSYSGFIKFILGRPILALYLVVLPVIILFAELGTQLLQWPLTFPLIMSFYVPQIVHGFLESSERNLIDIGHITLIALSKVFPLWAVCFFFSGPTEDTFLRLQCSFWEVATTTAWLGVQCYVIHLQATKGNKWLLPKFLRPKKYEYAATGSAHDSAIHDEGAECPICKNALSDVVAPEDSPTGHGGGGDAHESTAFVPIGPVDNVWVTPCKHYFHSICLLEWLEENTVCPMCRMSLPKP